MIGLYAQTLKCILYLKLNIFILCFCAWFKKNILEEYAFFWGSDDILLYYYEYKYEKWNTNHVLMHLYWKVVIKTDTKLI